MKKILLSVISLCLGILSYAEVVTLQEARKFAGNYFSSSSVDFVWNGKDPDARETPENPAFYVFNGPEGWAVIAGDDCATPVLMHGDGKFDPDNMPDNMRGLLDDIAYNILDARKRHYTAPAEVALQWKNVVTKASSTSTAEKTVLLETAKWNQNSPFNKFVPAYEGNQCYAGCVATAMAIVIRYNEWPKVGKGVIPGYVSDYHSQKTQVAEHDIEGMEFDYSKMPLTYSARTWKTENVDAVAHLIEICGAMVKMGYSTVGSGAVSANIPPALVKYMSYASTASEIAHRNFDNAGWFQLLKREIDYDHPVIYGGSDTGGAGGHQFVCDGYNSNNEIHINWGWGGSSNAWYAVNYLGGNMDYVFSRSDVAIVGLVPDLGDDTVNDPLLIQIGATSLVSGTIGTGESFKVSFSRVANLGEVKYTKLIRPALVGMDGAVKEFIGSGYPLDLDNGYSKTITFQCRITGPVAVGDRIALFYDKSDDEWVPVDMKNVVSGPLGVYDIPFIDVASEVKKGYIFYPRIVFGLKRPSDSAGVSWTVNGEPLPNDSFTFSSKGNYTIKAVVTNSDGSTDTLVKTVVAK